MDTIYLIIPAIIFALVAQIMVKVTFGKYSSVMSSRGMTASEVARQILDENGLNYVSIELVSGKLTDHFDPRSNVVRLSQATYYSTSVAAIGVAAHEVGHAVQHATGYTPIAIRNSILPIANIGTKLSIPLVILGIIMSFDPLIAIGICLYSFIVLFQLITLPVEFNASGSALATLEEQYILDSDETGKARKVLMACALTYVAAMLSSLLSLVRLIAISSRRNK